MISKDKFKELRSSGLGERFDDGKTRYSLIPPEALEGLAEIYSKGAERHADYNWLGLSEERILDAMERHIMEYKKGNKWNMKDWGHHTLLHVAWGALNLAYIDIMEEPCNSKS